MWKIYEAPNQPLILLPFENDAPIGYNEIGITADPNYLSNTVSSGNKITKRAFRDRLLPAEKVAIELASIDDPNANSQERQISALIRVFKEDLANASYIDLSNSNVQSALEVFEQYGIIASGRALTIINTPVTIDEIQDQLL